MINRLPWRKKLRTSAANNLDKINEIVDYINHSDISPVTLSDSATGRIVDVGMASSMKGLEVFGESVQNGVPTPDVPVPIQVVRGINLLENTHETSVVINGITWTKNADGSVTANGTASSKSTYYLKTSSRWNLKPGVYTLSDGGAGSSIASVELSCQNCSASYPKTNNGNVRFTANEGARTVAYITVAANATVSNLTFYPQLEKSSTAHPYVPYGYLGLSFTVDGETTIITLPLPSKGFAASLPDATRDVLTIDSTGKWEWANNVAHIASYDGESVGDVYMSTTGQLTTGAEVYYKVEPTTESGYIDVPEIPNGATVTIEATITPEFDLSWWSYQDITDMIADLMEYTDWKVSQVEGASTLGNNRLGVNPVVKEIVEIGKIEEVPAETEGEEVPEEIEDTEVE